MQETVANYTLELTSIATLLKQRANGVIWVDTKPVPLDVTDGPERHNGHTCERQANRGREHNTHFKLQGKGDACNKCYLASKPYGVFDGPACLANYTGHVPPLKRSQEAFVQCWCYGRSWAGYDCGGGGGGGGGGGEREHRTRRL